MSRFSRRGLLGGLTLAVGAGMVANAAYAQDVVYIPTAPPTPRVETVPPPPPGRVETWQPGYWQWTGAGYVWVSGRYVETPRRGAVWIPGRWEHRPQGWIYVAGHWG
jgi:hypothetical protein